MRNFVFVLFFCSTSILASQVVIRNSDFSDLAYQMIRDGETAITCSPTSKECKIDKVFNHKAAVEKCAQAIKNTFIAKWIEKFGKKDKDKLTILGATSTSTEIANDASYINRLKNLIGRTTYPETNKGNYYSCFLNPMHVEGAITGVSFKESADKRDYIITLYAYPIIPQTKFETTSNAGKVTEGNVRKITWKIKKSNENKFSILPYYDKAISTCTWQISYSSNVKPDGSINYTDDDGVSKPVNGFYLVRRHVVDAWGSCGGTTYTRPRIEKLPGCDNCYAIKATHTSGHGEIVLADSPFVTPDPPGDDVVAVIKQL